ncbi:histidinol-phosphate transaminase [Legionella sp. W05-934-2]|uniref:histidinol-phosphate transaminase n=1 Tax=Legionella sp. W05-934-2 TaxID=1198649 RepID=UPI00346188AF
MIDWNQYIHRGIQSLKPYQPGKSVDDLFRERGVAHAIKLASNENPLGCSPNVLSALSNITAEQIATYPNAIHHPLKQKIAEQVSLSPNQILLANGSDSIFSLVFTLFCLHQQKEVLTHQQCFPSYPIQAKGLGIPTKQISLNDNWQWAVSSFIEACTSNTGVLLFANPNNPTGVIVSQLSIKELLQSVPENVIVIVDEAYYEYAFVDASESALPLLQHFPNLIITRTFSKAYGLAALRLGYAMANESIIELLWRIQQPFAVNNLALHCGEIAWDDQAFVQQSIELNAKGLAHMAQAISEMGYPLIPSHANFITFDAGVKASALNDYLLNKGVIIRPLAGAGMPHHLRVSIGNPQQNARFLDALNQFSDNKLSCS